jgi:hypothetical protein
MHVKEIARLCHEVNRAFCMALNENSQVPWDEAPEWQRDSAVNGVEYILANDNTTPHLTHENWLRQKIAEGWTYGEVKDPDEKKHPCCVPYDELPVEQRAKDFIFGAIVRNVRAIEADRLGDGAAGRGSREGV